MVVQVLKLLVEMVEDDSHKEERHLEVDHLYEVEVQVVEQIYGEEELELTFL